jgi:hypothetical protein
MPKRTTAKVTAAKRAANNKMRENYPKTSAAVDRRVEQGRQVAGQVRKTTGQVKEAGRAALDTTVARRIDDPTGLKTKAKVMGQVKKATKTMGRRPTSRKLG